MGANDGAVARRQQWTGEVVDVVRAASGGLLFGVPLLYTVEVTWTGQHTSPQQSLALIGACVAVLVVLNRTAGFRSTTDTTWREALLDAVEGVAVAIVVTVATLALLGEIDTSQPLGVALGKTANAALAVSIGVGVANNILRERSSDDTAQEEPDPRGEPADGQSSLNATVADLGANTLGAVFLSLSIAPTDEVPMLAASKAPAALIAIVVASVLVAYAIVFVAGFAGQSRRREASGLLQHPAIETVASYAISLLTACGLLALFQRGDAPWRVLLAQTVVLGFPAAIGGAAGRLAI